MAPPLRLAMQSLIYQLDLHVAVSFDCPETPCGWSVLNFTCVYIFGETGRLWSETGNIKSYYCLDSTEGWSLILHLSFPNIGHGREEERQSIHSFITPSVVRLALYRAFWTFPEANCILHSSDLSVPLILRLERLIS